MQQQTKDWRLQRLGLLTGTRFAATVGSGKTHDDLMKDLAWERYTGSYIEKGFTTDAMQRGIDLEPEARDWYRFHSGLPVVEHGFMVHPSLPYVGMSPDGLVGDDGMVEIKCPGHRAHIETIESLKVPSQYRWQVQGQLWVSGRQWLDFVSYHPEHDGVVIRVLPSKADHEKLEAACIAANEEIEKIVSLLKSQKGNLDGTRHQ